MKEHSKILSAIMVGAFIFVLLFCCSCIGYLVYTKDGNIYDFAVLGTMVSVVGGITGLVCKHYYSKSGLENVAKIKKGFYEEIMRVRIEYDEKYLNLIDEHNTTKEAVDEIEYGAPFRNLSESVLMNMDNKFEEVDAINSTEPEIQS